MEQDLINSNEGGALICDGRMDGWIDGETDRWIDGRCHCVTFCE